MLSCTLYENLMDKIIDREEYENLKQLYTRRTEEAEEQANVIREQMNSEMESSSKGRDWMGQFRKHQSIASLDRSIVVSLIERILIFKDQRVEIVYRWHNEYQWQLDLLLQAQNELPQKEVI